VIKQLISSIIVAFDYCRSYSNLMTEERMTSNQDGNDSDDFM